MEKHCEERLIEVEQRSKSNTKRIDKLEHDTEVMREMVASVKVLDTKMDYVTHSQDELKDRLTHIEEKPEQRMNQITSALITAVIGLVVGFLFGGGM